MKKTLTLLTLLLILVSSTTALVITHLEPTDLTDNSGVLHVEVSEVSTVTINLYQDSTLINTITGNGKKVYDFKFEGLSPETSYTYDAQATSDLETSTKIYTFDNTQSLTPLITTKVIILSNIISNPSDVSAEINWSSNFPTSSKVIYSKNQNLSNNLTKTGSYSTKHNIVLTGLESGITYYYQVYSGNKHSDLKSFLSKGDLIPPQLTILNKPKYAHSQIIEIDGISDKGSIIKPFVNDLAQSTVTVESSAFTIKLNLNDGINNIIIKSVDEWGNEATESFVVLLDQNIPNLVVENVPTSSTQETVSLKISVDEPNTININSISVQPDVKINPPNNFQKTGTFSLSWSAPSNVVVKQYNIYKDGLFYAQTNSLSWSDSNFGLADETHSYQVSALDENCNEGELSTVIDITSNSGTSQLGFPKEKKCIPKDSYTYSFELSSSTTKQIKLHNGQNEIIISATDNGGSVNEQTFNILYDDTPPKLILDYIPERVYKKSLEISGTVNEPSVVELNLNGKIQNITASYDEDAKTYHFSKKLTLSTRNRKEDIGSGLFGKKYSNNLKVSAKNSLGLFLSTPIEKDITLESCPEEGNVYSLSITGQSPESSYIKYLKAGTVTMDAAYSLDPLYEGTTIKKISVKAVKTSSLDYAEDFSEELIKGTPSVDGDENGIITFELNKFGDENKSKLNFPFVMDITYEKDDGTKGVDKICFFIDLNVNYGINTSDPDYLAKQKLDEINKKIQDVQNKISLLSNKFQADKAKCISLQAKKTSLQTAANTACQLAQKLSEKSIELINRRQETFTKLKTNVCFSENHKTLKGYAENLLEPSNSKLENGEITFGTPSTLKTDIAKCYSKTNRAGVNYNSFALKGQGKATMESLTAKNCCDIYYYDSSTKSSAPTISTPSACKLAPQVKECITQTKEWETEQEAIDKAGDAAKSALDACDKARKAYIDFWPSYTKTCLRVACAPAPTLQEHAQTWNGYIKEYEKLTKLPEFTKSGMSGAKGDNEGFYQKYITQDCNRICDTNQQFSPDSYYKSGKNFCSGE